MNFLNPLFLAGLATAVIPVLIYLWTRKNRKTLRFSSIFLFQRIEASAIRSLKITEWLLVLLRILALIFLVLGFSQPFLPSAEPQIISQSITHILVDESPEFYFTDGQNKKSVLKSKMDDLIQSIVTVNPSVQVFSTDSLNNYRYLSGPSDDPTLFHGIPPFVKSMDSTSFEQVLIITKKDAELLHRLKSNQKKFQLLLIEDDQFLKNTGIVDVSFPNLIWQTTEANSVTVTLQNYDKKPVRFSLESWVDRQLIHTQSIEMENGIMKTQIPVQVYQRGWHELLLKINTTDFSFDNEWNGGFYLPEQLNLKYLLQPLKSQISPSALEASAKTVGLEVTSRSELPSVVIMESSQTENTLTMLTEQNRGIIWIPDFSDPAKIKSQLNEMGIVVRSVSENPVRMKNFSRHSFWNFIKKENSDLLSNNESQGLIETEMPFGISVLAWSADQKPMMLLGQIKNKPILIFLTNPFTRGKNVPVWALSALFHGMNFLNQPTELNGGFSYLSVKKSNGLSVPSVPGRLSVEWKDKQVEILAAGALRDRLPQQMINTVGRLTLRFEGEIVQKSGINYPFSAFENLTIPENSISLKSDSDFLSLTRQDSRSLSILFFVLSLLCFLVESLISNVRWFLPKA